MRCRIGSAAWVALIALFIGGCTSEKTPELRVKEPVNVELSTTDGKKIVATWHEVTGSNAAVILVPTLAFGPENWSRTADRMIARNWSVMQTDLRSDIQPPARQGEPWRASRADSASVIADFANDVLAAIDFVEKASAENVKIVVVGADLGGIAGINAAAAKRKVAGVAILNPPGGLGVLISQGVISAYGDRPLLILTELPVHSVLTTPRTLDSWLGRGSALTVRHKVPSEPSRIPDRQSAVNTLMSWISSTAL